MSTKFFSTQMLSRALLYATLLVGAAFFLAPLYVMVVTSLKDADEIRQNSLVSLPGAMNFDAWRLAWDSACTGAQCSGLEPFFWNSVWMAVPAVLISTIWGALNGLSLIHI